jgi:mono/diheme cytochrome c family protein
MTSIRLGSALFAAALIISVSSLLAADDNAPSNQQTFYKDVLPVFQSSCQICHRPGGANLGGMVAPMALVTYEEVRPWAKSIAAKVKAREMPPWHASPAQSGLFTGERVLTDAQIDTIVRWTATGAVAGNKADAPAAITWPSLEGWQIGEPDLIVKIPKPYFIGDDVVDVQPTFRTPITDEMLPEDRWIKAVEFRPGNGVVHHIIAPPLGGIAPGNAPLVYKEGYGQLLRKGSSVTWQMHYHKEAGPGTGVWDNDTCAAIKFYPKGETPKYPIEGAPLGNFMFRIPPNADNHEVAANFTMPYEAKILSFMPHMHLRGKNAKITAAYPDGREEVLLEVPKYDYNWQTRYEYIEPKVVPEGTKINISAHFNNSASNPNNPDPSKEIRFGEKTDDEMMFGFMAFSPVDPTKAPPPGQSRGFFGGNRGGRRGEGGGRGILEEMDPEIRERLREIFRGLREGDPDAQNNLQEILKDLTPEQREAIRERFQQRGEGRDRSAENQNSNSNSAPQGGTPNN